MYASSRILSDLSLLRTLYCQLYDRFVFPIYLLNNIYYTPFYISVDGVLNPSILFLSNCLPDNPLTNDYILMYSIFAIFMNFGILTFTNVYVQWKVRMESGESFSWVDCFQFNSLKYASLGGLVMAGFITLHILTLIKTCSPVFQIVQNTITVVVPLSVLILITIKERESTLPLLYSKFRIQGWCTEPRVEPETEISYRTSELGPGGRKLRTLDPRNLGPILGHLDDIDDGGIYVGE